MTRPTHHAQRVRSVAAWVAWHATELAALTIPVLLALTVTPWAWLLVVAVAAGWVAHEVREQRHDHHTDHERPPALNIPEQRRELTTTETDTAEHPATADDSDTTTEETRHG